jgi:serpin B
MRRSVTLVLAAALLSGCTGATPSPAPTGTPIPTGEPTPAGPTPTAGPTGPATPNPTLNDEFPIELAEADIARLTTTPGDAASAGEAVNAFGLDLYKRIVAADPTANAVFSPASIAIALSMARAGARGATAAEMDAVMAGLGADKNAAWVAALDASLNAKTATSQDASGDPVQVTLSSVNQPFAQRGYPLDPAYLTALGERFGAGLRMVDYIGDTTGARDAINAWVAEQTKDRIPKLIPDDQLDESTRLVLVNAIYLKAPWAVPFFEGATQDEPFTKLDGTTMQVPTMHTGGFYDYAEGTGWQALQLPYAGNGLAMLVIVPDDLAAFEKTLDAGKLAGITGALASQDATVALPKFGAETSVDLAEILKAAGMPTAFQAGAADFSGITTADPLYIGAVIHQANIDVDEKGTEAAAATAVEGLAGAAAPQDLKDFRADRPFLYALRDLESGAIVFMGRVTKPGPRS